jgi:hypothetical protein
MYLLRIALDRPQGEMGKLLGHTSHSAWAQYETGVRRIRLDCALTLCEKTGVTLDWIYRGDIRLLAPDMVKRLHDAEAWAKASDENPRPA